MTPVPQFTSSDVLVRVQSRLQSPSNHFNIKEISFSASTTRSGHFNKMVHSLARKSKNGHFYFNRLSRLWNTVPPVDLTSSAEQLDLIRNHFNNNFNPSNPCMFHFLCPCFKCSHTLTPPPPPPPFFFNCVIRLLGFQVDPQSALLPSLHPHTLFISCSHLQVFVLLNIIIVPITSQKLA